MRVCSNHRSYEEIGRSPSAEFITEEVTDNPIKCCRIMLSGNGILPENSGKAGRIRQKKNKKNKTEEGRSAEKEICSMVYIDTV